MKFGLIGKDISRSQSPALFSRYNPGTDSSYELVDTDDFDSALDFVRENGFRAVNVTAPFKDRAFECATEHDRISSLTRTSNLLLFSGDSIKSFNTDYYGVHETVQQLLISGDRLENALVLGCGGAGKAAVLALLDLGLNVYLANRNVFKAQELADRYNAAGDKDSNSLVKVVDFDFIENGNYDMLLSALSSTPEDIKKKISALKKKIIFEAEYRHPVLDGIIGNQYIAGTEWLKNQAIPGFRIFFQEF